MLGGGYECLPAAALVCTLFLGRGQLFCCPNLPRSVSLIKAQRDGAYAVCTTRTMEADLFESRPMLMRHPSRRCEHGGILVERSQECRVAPGVITSSECECSGHIRRDMACFSICFLFAFLGFRDGDMHWAQSTYRPHKY